MAIRDVATFSIEQPLYTWLLIAACFFGGLWGIDTVGRLEDPAFPIKSAFIITPYPGASALEVEQEVTDVMEAALQAGAHIINDVSALRHDPRALEFVADRDTKTPFDPTLKIAARLKAAAMENGLICYPMSGTINGQIGDHVLLAPPFISTEAQIDELVDKLSASLKSVL